MAPENAQPSYRDDHLSILVPNGLLLCELHDAGSLSAWPSVDQHLPAKCYLLHVNVISHRSVLAEAIHHLLK